MAEVLAAMLLMAIVIPVAMNGVSSISRVGTLSQRKEQAMRIARRVLAEQLLTGAMVEQSSSGSISEGGTTFPYTVSSEPWSEDSMTVVTATVSFRVQEADFDVSLSTLYDPNAASASTATTQ
jgi:type II secretory pathway pseudopilin PulG